MELPWQLPIVQAPVGRAATPELVVAVSRAGGLGTLAASWTKPDELRRQLRTIRAELETPFCVNLVLAFDQRERLEVVLAEGVRVVSFSWGISADLIEAAHAAEALVLVQVGDVSEAVSAVASGADVLIAQGAEAGGHVQGTVSALELLRGVRAKVHVPLVAAGGIGDATDVGRAMDAGADAVVCGTAFLAAHEADVHPRYLDRLIRAAAEDTALTTVFDVGWPDAPHRVLRNETLERWEQAGCPPAGRRPGERDTVATRAGRPIVRYSDAQPTTGTTGDIDAMAMYAGTSVTGVRAAEPAGTIVRRLASGLE